jgi:hypothetical protein
MRMIRPNTRTAISLWPAQEEGASSAGRQPAEPKPHFLVQLSEVSCFAARLQTWAVATWSCGHGNYICTGVHDISWPQGTGRLNTVYRPLTLEPYPEAEESNSHPPIIFLFNIMPPIYVYLQCASFRQILLPKLSDVIKYTINAILKNIVLWDVAPWGLIGY